MLKLAFYTYFSLSLVSARNHQTCSFMAEYDFHKCDDFYERMFKQLNGMHQNGTSPDPAGGEYHIVKNVTNKSLWATREKKVGNRNIIWDLSFEFLEEVIMPSCLITSTSRVRNDFVKTEQGTEFCNLYNVFNGTGFTWTRDVVD